MEGVPVKPGLKYMALKMHSKEVLRATLPFFPQAVIGPFIHHLASELLQMLASLPLTSLSFIIILMYHCFWKTKKQKNPNWIIQWIVTHLL